MIPGFRDPCPRPPRPAPVSNEELDLWDRLLARLRDPGGPRQLDVRGPTVSEGNPCDHKLKQRNLLDLKNSQDSVKRTRRDGQGTSFSESLSTPPFTWRSEQVWAGLKCTFPLVKGGTRVTLRLS